MEPKQGDLSLLAHPYRVLSIRGTARVAVVDGVPAEYAAAVKRYAGAEAGRAREEQMARIVPRMARIAIRPEWVGVLDFATRFPRGIVRGMQAGLVASPAETDAGNRAKLEAAVAGSVPTDRRRR